ncbi:unnamed protein product [Lepeophtheirus salmonis]|uniref:(salmon louse) hypothetical protein n=1 Tax=Lepeophtheirus salmonis TaxID=72036 RepID=A0A7R8CKM3_LEPSM|nr:unnamed protein product [Lepeophtheirus salmonis]CAF2847840.1 unnamed protein product [Lepeophtheirus salmonis]
MKILLAFSALIALTSAQGYHPTPSYEQPAHYAYNYGVVDDYSGNNFGQSESRDGYVTSGEYHVQLPDGRLQTVNYHVGDAYTGYVADVTYSGTPSYGPAPIHHTPIPIHHHAAPIPHHPLPLHHQTGPFFHHF